MSARDDLDSILVLGQDDGLRRASLALHGLSSADRQWMIERLPVQKRADLQQLLHELTALGIPADRRLARLAVEALPHQAVPTDSTSPAARRAESPALVPLRLERTADVARILATESAEFAARCLQLGSATWRQGVIAHLPQALAEQVREMTEGTEPPACPAHLARALLEVLERAMAKCEPQSEVVARPVHHRAWGLFSVMRGMR